MNQSPRLNLTVYLATPARIIPVHGDTAEAEASLSKYVLEHHPLAHTTFDGAAQEALMAAPTPEDSEEWTALIAIGHGCHPAAIDVEAIEPPKHVSYILEVALGDIRIATTNDPAKSSHLAFRSHYPEIDVLWLPDGEDSSWLPDDDGKEPSRLRIITHRSLIGHLTLIRSTAIPARSRPLA